mgnify:CR=1 FL=1
MMADCKGVGSDHILALWRVGAVAEADCLCGWSEAHNVGLIPDTVPEPLAGLLVAVWFDDAWDRHHAAVGLAIEDPTVKWEAWECARGTVADVAELQRAVYGVVTGAV